MVDLVAAQERFEFILERATLVMVALPEDVCRDIILRGLAYAEDRVSRLPREIPAERLLDPDRAPALDVAHEVGHRGIGPPANEHVQVIGHAADRVADALFAAHRAAEILVQARLDPGRDELAAILGAEDDVQEDVSVR